MAKLSRELQFSTQQLVGVFLGILALGIFVFLLGISVGKKQTDLAAGGRSVALKTETAAVKAPPVVDPSKSAIQKELDAHDRADATKTASPAEPSAKPAEKTPDKPLEKPADKTAEKPAEKPAVKDAGAKPGAAKAQAAGGWYIQVTAVADKPSASAFADKLQKEGYPTVLLEPTAKDKKTVFRVRVGPYATKAEADEAKTKLAEASKKKKSDYFLVKG